MINLYKLLFFIPVFGIILAIVETSDFDHFFFTTSDSYYDFLIFLIIQHLSMFILATLISKYI